MRSLVCCRSSSLSIRASSGISCSLLQQGAAFSHEANGWSTPSPGRGYASSSQQVISQEDSTLAWARKNPEIAQRCLQPPPFDAAPDKNLHYWNSLEEYCQWRRWTFPTTPDHSETDPNHGILLASHVLSAPLTLAKFHNTTVKKESGDHSRPLRWACVGARAESTLPYHYWKEMLFLLSNHDNHQHHVSMDFCGPEVHPKIPNNRIELDGSALSLQWFHRGLFHELPTTKQQPDWDAYILLNPGVGHGNLRQDWKPTLVRLLSSGKPILMTAHSEKDAARDTQLLAQEYQLSVDYQVNPFRSRIKYPDPFDQHHVVSPNHYVATILPS
jgi:hypothetical protein